MSDPAPSQPPKEQRKLVRPHPDDEADVLAAIAEAESGRFIRLTPEQFVDWLKSDTMPVGSGVELTPDQADAYVRWLETGALPSL